MGFKTARRPISKLSYLAIIIGLEIVGFNNPMIAQEKDSLSVVIENGYIELMKRKIAMDVSFNNSYETFEVRTAVNRIVLYPNNPTSIRFKFNHRFISFGFQFAPDFIPGNGDEYIKGKTKSFALGTALTFKHWYFELSYSKVQGYYLKNTDDYTNRKAGDPYIQFPDLHYYGFSLLSGYFHNPKFSFKSLTIQTERQLKSTGCFIPVLNVRYYVIDDKSSPINTQKSNNLEANLGPGYAYTFVIQKSIYFSLGLGVSLGYLNTKLTTRLSAEDIIVHQNNFIFRWDGKAGLGYNGNRFYSGLYTNISGSQYQQQNTTVMNFETRVFYHLFFGMRFNSPDALTRQMDKIEKKFN